MRNLVSRFVHLLLIVALSLVLAPVISAAPPVEWIPTTEILVPTISPSPEPEINQHDALPGTNTQANDSAWLKVDPLLRSLSSADLKAPQEVAVLVIAAPGQVDYSAFGRVIADNTFSTLGLRHVYLKLPLDLLAKLASVSEVYAVTALQTSAAPAVADSEAPGALPAAQARTQALSTDLQAKARAGHKNARPITAPSIVQPSSAVPANSLQDLPQTQPDVNHTSVQPLAWFENSTQGVWQTWQLGYYGTGDAGNNLKIAVIDTGCDFCTPALWGRYAVEHNGTAYDGWPIAYDDYSASQFMSLYPEDGAQVGGNWGWYVNAKYLQAGEGSFEDPIYAMSLHTPNTSLSGVYFYGYHPDSIWHILALYAANPVMLVADTVVSGTYDTVYIDADFDGYYTGTADLALSMSNPVGCIDWTGPNGTPDGVADDSYGMLYWISDGVNPLPGLKVIYGDSAPIPPRGRVLMFMINDSSLAGGDHGTLVASSAAGFDRSVYRDYQGIIAFASGPEPSIVQGPASGGSLANSSQGTRIISMGNYYRGGSAFNNYLFTVFGYDGAPDGVDDPAIVNISYGSTSEDVDAWDFESEYLAALNLSTEALGLRSPLYTIAAGNAGHGYGTITSPDPTTALMVGASTEYGSYNWWGVYEGVSSENLANYQDVQPWSSRGPTAMSTLAPHVVANGAWGSGAIPVNEATYNNGYDGTAAWEVWGGTSRSAPVAAGMAALVYDYYYADHGVYPTWRQARQYLMNGALEVHYDEQVAGAGQADPYTAIQRMKGMAGVEVEPPFLQAGAYPPESGMRYESAAIGLYPGMTQTTVFTFTNRSPALQTLVLTDEQLQLVSRHVITLTSDGSESLDNYAYGTPNYVIKLNGFIVDNAGADLMIVRVVQPFENFDETPLPPTPSTYSNRWTALLYTVFDNGNGIWWTDKDGNGKVDISPTVAFNLHELDQDDEFIRTSYSYLKGTGQEVRMNDPWELMNRVGAQSDIYLGLAKRASDGRPTTLTIEILFYLENDWDQVSIAPSHLLLPPTSDPHDPTIATATLTVGAVGTYDLMIDDFDAAPQPWQATGLWHQVAPTDSCLSAYSMPNAVAFHNDSDCTYDIPLGTQVSGTLTYLDPILLPPLPLAELSFMSYESTECQGTACAVDVRSLEGSKDGSSWETLWDSTRGSFENTWYERKVDISAWAGGKLFIRFRFDSVNFKSNGFQGWYIDNIKLRLPTDTDIYGEQVGRLRVTSIEAGIDTIVPIEKQVWFNPESDHIVLGGTPRALTPYDNGWMYGAFDWLGRGKAGDWRIYPYTISPDLPAGTVVLAQTTWDDYPTDIDMLFYQPAAPWLFGGLGGLPYNPDWFGPQTVDYSGAGSIRAGTRPNWLFYNAYAGYTGITTAEFVSAQAVAGLNILALQAVLYGGHQAAEPFTTTIGLASLSSNPVELVGLSCINCLAWITFTTNLDLPDGLTQTVNYGWYQPQEMVEEIIQGQFWSYGIILTDSLRLKLATKEILGASDIDLSLYRDDGDGVWDSFGDTLVASSGSVGSNESILYTAPPNGRYWIVVEGYNVTGAPVTGAPGTFLLNILNVAGAGAFSLLNLPSNITAGEVYSFAVRLDSIPPEPGYWKGLALLGTPQAPGVIELPVHLWQADTSYTTQPSVVNTGDLLTFTIAITVPTSAPPSYIGILHHIPEGTSFVAVQGATLMGTPAFVYWAGVSYQHSVTLTLRVTRSAPGPLVGTAYFGEDWNRAPIWCAKTATVTVLAPVIILSKTVSSSSIFPDSYITYTITIRNQGTLTSTVTMTDVVPQVFSDLQYTLPLTLVGGANDYFSWTGDIGPHSQQVLEWRGLTDRSLAPAGSSITNTAVVSWLQGLASSTVMVAVKPVEPAWQKRVYINGVLATTQPFRVASGDTLVVEDRVYISGSATVSMTLTEKLSVGLKPVTATSSGGAIDIGADYIQWRYTTAPPNGWEWITKIYRVETVDWIEASIYEMLEVRDAEPTFLLKPLSFLRQYWLRLPFVLKN